MIDAFWRLRSGGCVLPAAIYSAVVPAWAVGPLGIGPRWLLWPRWLVLIDTPARLIVLAI